MAFRAFFALPADKFVTSGGAHTNAVHGFINMLVSLITQEKPTHIGVAFDAGSHTFRTDEYPEYKGGRDATPEEFKGQVPLLKDVLASMNIKFLDKDMFEADDILATWAAEATANDMEVLVCSGDRDAFQLVNEHVTVLYPVKGVSELKRYTPEAVEEKYGVRPENYPDLAALTGETADNIPGVPGVGPKTAAKWITQFGSLEAILDGADTIKGKVGDNLRAHLDQVRRNRQINRLLTDVDLAIGVLDLGMAPWDREAMNEIFDVLEFRTLRERLFKLMPAGEVEGSAVQTPDIELDVTIFDSEHTVLDWLDAAGPDPVSVVVEGTQTPYGGSAWTVALGSTGDRVGVARLDELSDANTVVLRDWLANEQAPKVVHNVKGVWHALNRFSGGIRGVRFDVELGAYLAHPDQRTYGLDVLAERYLFTSLAPTETSGEGEFDLGLEDDSQNQQLALQASAVLKLEALLRTELRERNSLSLIEELELPLADALASMEHDGVAIDTQHLRGLEGFFAQEAETAANEAYEAIGRKVNLGSPKQLQEVLFDQLDMPKTRKTKTGYTTDAAALSDLFEKTQHPFLKHLLSYRDVTKLKQTVETLLKSVTPDDRIHTTFQQTVAATGRLSSTDPNLQNIPVRSEMGRRIREAFIVGEGYETLITADYSQIEMRIMAHLSGDDSLIAAFKAGEDLHNYVGSRVFNVSTDEVTPEMRSKVKAMSYGLAYGLTDFGLSKQLKVSVSEARTLMEDYFERFGGVSRYLHEVVEQARVDGYTETILGRRRYLPDLTSDNRQRRENAERVALNAPIQGSAADIIKIAMIRVDKRLREENLESRLLLQIHDELLIEAASGEIEQVEAILREEMSGAMELSVPLSVSVGRGRNWHEAGH
jgi:DNA polymerase-1